ncbi:hypothetical protein [Iamia sp.]|uniref:hypothetical protein n=1 Tax=Iamia sp. TaxID=2722710 RepID=UPI002C1B624D|nr:hypothetical protein [Iamia sp.]HXH55785.1 hypothetical protein [Iamia sp.]
MAATSRAHERTLTDRVDGGCVIATDQLIIEPRVGLARPLVAVIAVRLFHHRHLRLRRRFGTP